MDNQLPPGLPPLPEVPEGYDRWVYRGTEVASRDCPPMTCSLLWGNAYPNGEMEWYVYEKDFQVGRTGTHWCEAIPVAPAPSGEGKADQRALMQEYLAEMLAKAPKEAICPILTIEALFLAMPRDLQKKVSCHDLKRTVDNYNDALIAAEGKEGL